MDMRDIEIFLTLADELHFGRTAKRLYVSQARVSQAIKAQERRIGGPLFLRTSRSVRLTPLGEHLAQKLRTGYDGIQQALAEAAATAALAEGTLTIGVMGALGHELAPLAADFTARHPDCRVAFREVHFSHPFTALRQGKTDAALLWLPVREPDLTIGPVVLREGRVLAVGANHALAQRAEADLEDLGDHSALTVDHGLPESWISAMLPSRTPLGRPVTPAGPPMESFHEVLTHVAAGTGICPLNAHVLRYYTHPGIRFLPMPHAPTTEWALVWRTEAELPRVLAFAAFVREYDPQSIP
ncbi:transcriptional regulator, LysR family [Streptomyces sp. 2131.1]|uniref:LysR family transcriptional regulator n=1 Tax=Streptomyces sp. 2131.1 TaxID=1855346 RepID=UPI00089AFF08|nr:LysR family transcriptional regulator [Streptomyces sp. 2131.1]SEE45972.1 transcriptional regulator, LysR family [Streptomyces sp. 2131.1]